MPNCQLCVVPGEYNASGSLRPNVPNELKTNSRLQAIHVDRNCKQYQDDLKHSDMDGDTRRSQLYMDEIVEKNLGMKCPKCQVCF